VRPITGGKLLSLLLYLSHAPDNRPIHLLNDDALLNIFELYPLDILDSYHDILSQPNWDAARWWYKLAQVCRRWRYLILLSPVRLGLHLVCTYDTPVADMLEHSPPLPIIVNYLDEDRETTAGDEEAILLALQYRDRVRRIGIKMPATNLLKHLMAMDELLASQWDLHYLQSPRASLPSSFGICRQRPTFHQVILSNDFRPCPS